MDYCKKPMTREDIIAFHFWYRLATIMLVVIFALTGIKRVYLLPLMFAIIYTVIIIVLRFQVIDKVQKYPAFLSIDITISFVLLASSGGYKSPYYLYSYSSLILGACLFGYRGAFLLAGIQSILFFIAVRVNGYQLSNIVSTGENIVTDYFFFFLIGVSAAYLSELVNKLNYAIEQKNTARRNLKLARERLLESLKLHRLSAREMKVFILAFEGLTIEAISQELSISRHTVKTYLNRAYNKLGVTTKREAIAKAMCRENS